MSTIITKRQFPGYHKYEERHRQPEVFSGREDCFL